MYIQSPVVHIQFYAQNFDYIFLFFYLTLSEQWIVFGGEKRHRTRKRSFKMPFTRFHKRNMVCVTLNDYHGKWFASVCVLYDFFFMNSSNENWFGRLLYVSDIIFCCFVWFIHSFFHSFIHSAKPLKSIISKMCRMNGKTRDSLKILCTRSQLWEKYGHHIYIFITQPPRQFFLFRHKFIFQQILFKIYYKYKKVSSNENGKKSIRYADCLLHTIN